MVVAVVVDVVVVVNMNTMQTSGFVRHRQLVGNAGVVVVVVVVVSTAAIAVGERRERREDKRRRE